MPTATPASHMASTVPLPTQLSVNLLAKAVEDHAIIYSRRKIGPIYISALSLVLLLNRIIVLHPKSHHSIWTWMHVLVLPLAIQHLDHNLKSILGWHKTVRSCSHKEHPTEASAPLLLISQVSLKYSFWGVTLHILDHYLCV